MRPWILALLLLSLVPAGCPHYQSSADKLRRSVMDYNEGVRWQNWKIAAEYVPPDERADFLARKEAQGERVRVTDFEIRDVTHDSAESKAYVIVDFTWHRYPSLTIHQTRVRQSWVGQGGGWFLEGQEEIKPEAEELTPDKMF